MENERRRDLVMSGMMRAAGGLYDQASLNGAVTVGGDVDCRRFLAHGRSKVTGRLKALRSETHGASSIAGDLVSGHVTIHGYMRVGGNVSAKSFAVHGKAGIKGQLTGEHVEIHGVLTVKGSCEAETFKSNGGFSVGGLLNAGVIDIRLYGKCEAREIGGETIVVRRTEEGLRHKLFRWLFVSWRPRLTADVIEGDEIRLEYTRARVVRGTDVTIGPGCEIGRVEYKGTFRRDRDAKVEESENL